MTPRKERLDPRLHQFQLRGLPLLRAVNPGKFPLLSHMKRLNLVPFASQQDLKFLGFLVLAKYFEQLVRLQHNLLKAGPQCFANPHLRLSHVFWLGAYYMRS